MEIIKGSELHKALYGLPYGVYFDIVQCASKKWSHLSPAQQFILCKGMLLAEVKMRAVKEGGGGSLYKYSLRKYKKYLQTE